MGDSARPATAFHAVVATVVVTNDQPATIEPGVIEFLNSVAVVVERNGKRGQQDYPQLG